MRALKLWLAGIALAVSMAVGAFAADTDFPYVKGEIIVRMSPGTTLPQAQALANQYGLVIVRPLRTPGMYLLRLPDPNVANERTLSQERLDALRGDVRVQHAILNHYAQKYQVPNDPLWSTTAELSEGQWNLRQIGLPGPSGAWAVHKGLDGVFVVDLDDNFYMEHPDFRDAANNSRFFSGYNAYDGSDDPRPDFPIGTGFSHGTMTASVIIAGTDNGIGMAGVTWEGVKLIPVRIATPSGSLPFALIYDGYQWVIDWLDEPSNPRIIAQNMSYGAGFPDDTSDLLLQKIADRGVVLFAASGNSRPFPAGWPASFAQVTSVAATKWVSAALEKGFPTSYSSPGSPDGLRKVDIAAPSADTIGVWELIYDPLLYDPNGGGTSYACPTAVGAAALLHSAGMASFEIVPTLKLTAVVAPGDPVPNLDTGYGEIDVASAMTFIVPSVKGIKPNQNSTFPYQTVNFEFRLFKVSVAAPAPVVEIARADGSYGPVAIPSSNWTITPDPILPNVSWLRGYARLIDGGGISEGDWKIICTGEATGPTDGVEISGEILVTIRHHVVPAGVNMISLPYSIDGESSPPGGRKPETIFPVGFELFRWIPSIDLLGNPTGSYAQYSEFGANTQDAGFTPSSFESFQQLPGGVDVPLNGPYGVGWWLKAPSDAVLDVELGPEPGVEGYKIKLKPGWNQVGDPFEFFVDWNACLITEIPSGRVLTLAQAISERIVKPQIFRYELTLGGSKEYTWRSAPGGQFVPFESHWIYAIEECWVSVPPTEAPERSRANNSTHIRGDGWAYSLTATSGGTSDSNNVFGTTRGLNELFDVVPEPPAALGSVSLWFTARTTEQALTQELRELSGGKEVWTFSVRPPKPNEDVTVTWREVQSPNRRLRMTLRDMATGRTVSMQTNGSYRFTADEQMTPRSFTVTVLPDAVGRLVVSGVRIAGGSRAGGQFTINYSVNVESTVSLRIVGAGGKVIADLGSASRSPGTQSVTWNGRDSRGAAVAPGVYMLQITAETTDGQRARTTSPITVTR